MLDKLFVFDIETIPDIDSARNLLNLKDKKDEDVLIELAKYHNPNLDPNHVFFKTPFHKIVAISFAVIGVEKFGNGEFYNLEEIRSGGTLESTENELIQGFFHYLNKITPKLVSFNGRAFDLPVLKYRAMAHQVSAGNLYKLGDKWNSYQNRYSSDWHSDLLELLSDYNASGRIRLNDVCSIFNLPGKVDVDGSSVYTLHKEGKIADIRNYCETDVLNTYLVYLRYALHSAKIDQEGFKNSTKQVLTFLEGNQDKEHYKKFYNAWSNADKNLF